MVNDHGPRERSVPCLSPLGFHTMHYREWGERENPRVLICVHGLTRNGRDFDTVAAALSDHYRVLCPDVVGRGRSDWLEHKELYGYPQYLADLTILIGRSGAYEVDWLGTSMGGLIGMLLASQPRSPVRRLVLNDIGPFIPATALRRIASYVGLDQRFPNREALDAYLAQIYAPFGPFSSMQWTSLVDSSIRETPDGKLALAYDPGIAQPLGAAPIADVDLWSVWDRLTQPVLLVRGARSDVLPSSVVEQMSQRGPALTVATVPDVGHAPSLMSTEQVDVVRHWLAMRT